MKHNRRLLKITGQDRAKLLNDILTIEITQDMPLSYGALLSAQGKIQTDLFIFSEGGSLIIDLPNSYFEMFKSKLSLYKLRADIAWQDDARIVSQGAGEGDPRGNLGKRLYGEDANFSEEEYRKMRIENCVPEFDIDFVTNQAYPREWRFDEMGGIDYRKGCFVGQEIIARMRHKSELNKSVLRISAPEKIHKGETVYSGDKPVGEILSAFENEALAFVKLKFAKPEKLRTEVQDLEFTI